MLCVRECPTWCITVESHVEDQTQEGARRPKKVQVLDEFTIDYGLCMYCGICVEVCPFDALEWQDDYDYPARDRAELVHDTSRLTNWRNEQ